MIIPNSEVRQQRVVEEEERRRKKVTQNAVRLTSILNHWAKEMPKKCWICQNNHAHLRTDIGHIERKQ